MNVFADLHHSGLYHSLHLLIEKRLGWNLYRPIGKDWFNEGYWDIAKPYNDNPDTISQFLAIRDIHKPSDGTPPLNTLQSTHSGHYNVEDTCYGYTQKAIEIERFKEMQFDIIIASIPAHWYTYKRLRDKYQPKAKLVCHMGNMFNEVGPAISDKTITNLMASAKRFPNISSRINKVFYHQELHPLFLDRETLSPKPNQITSFVNLLPAKEEYDAYRTALPEFDFNAYGSSTPDGFIDTIPQIKKLMGRSTWAWHVKPNGDGFGHVWYQWAFTGRPIITYFTDYEDKLGGEIFEDEVTGIDLGKRTMVKNIALIKKLSEPSTHQEMCRAIRDRTVQMVDYNTEEQLLWEFFSNLL